MIPDDIESHEYDCYWSKVDINKTVVQTLTLYPGANYQTNIKWLLTTQSGDFN